MDSTLPAPWTPAGPFSPLPEGAAGLDRKGGLCTSLSPSPCSVPRPSGSASPFFASADDVGPGQCTWRS